MENLHKIMKHFKKKDKKELIVDCKKLQEFTKYRILDITKEEVTSDNIDCGKDSETRTKRAQYIYQLPYDGRTKQENSNVILRNQRLFKTIKCEQGYQFITPQIENYVMKNENYEEIATNENYKTVKNEKKHTKVWQDLFTGCLAGVTDVLATHPLWTIKTLTQNNLTTFQIFRLMKDNPMILYNGVNAHMLTMIPITTTRVFFSSIFEKFLDQDDISLNLLASGIAGGISSLISSPTELARTIKLKSAVLEKDRLSMRYESSNIFKILKEVHRTEGINKIFNGYLPVAIRDGIYTAAFFSGTPILKRYVDPYFENTIAKTLFASSVVSLFSCFINHPFDTIKTVQHSLFAENWQLNSNNKYGFSDACKKIFETKGVQGFLTGYYSRGTRFLIGLTVKACVIEMMDNYWTNYNNSDVSENNNLLKQS